MNRIQNKNESVCTVLKVSSEGNPWLKSNSDVRAVAWAFQSYTRRNGGQSMAHFADGVLTIAIQGLTGEHIKELTGLWAEHERASGKTVTIEQRDNVPLPDGKKLGLSVRPGAVIAENLTRRLLFALPPGAYVASNPRQPITWKPLFAERLGEMSEREQVWKKVVESGAAGRLCYVSWMEEDFRKDCSLPDPTDNNEGEGWKNG
ncbi:MAG TPA: hypothetical protein VFB72_08430 [Verrucomicrobiae bacterium]|nr:hypothetical protein [Verrucomicrobiae bacterium]